MQRLGKFNRAAGADAASGNGATDHRLTTGTLAMKNVLIPLFAVMLVPAHAQFGPPAFIEETETRQPNQLALADLDGDGDNDLVSASMEGRVAWYANDGTGGFGPQQLITAIAYQARGLDVGDLDGDGDADVVSGGNIGNTIYWFENDGAGSFTEHIISAFSDGCWFLKVVDLDGDGDPDVLRVSQNDDSVTWYANDGGGNFGPVQPVAVFQQAYSAHASDLDGDGDLDIIGASAYTDELYWFANDGTCNFGSAQTIVTNVDGANNTTAADLDGDGDNDVLLAAFNVNTITWYENDGAGGFGPPQLITSALFYAHRVYTADMDGDGDPDVLSASGGDDKVAWYANDGTGSFGPQQIITTSAYWVTSALAGDADGDGDLDVFSTSQEDDKVAWYENDGAGAFGPTIAITISAAEPHTMHVGDLDGDGSDDLVVGMESSNGSRIGWYHNLGAGGMAGPLEITSLVDGALSLNTADMDGDGDADLLSASFDDQKFAWYANDGSGSFGPQQLIDLVQYPSSVVPVDVDGDGDQDILGGAYYSLDRYLNDGAGNFTGVQLSGGLHSNMSIADLDADGDGDLLFKGSSAPDYTMAWSPSDGLGNFGPAQVICVWNVLTSVMAADLDGDGDLDALCAAEDMLVWYANDGTGTFGPQQLIQGLTDDLQQVLARDVDNDGDQDVLSISLGDDKVAWYQNNGTGTFGPQMIIRAGLDEATCAVTTDLDGDGDADVIAANTSLFATSIEWYENHFESPYRIEGRVFHDVDLDGLPGAGEGAFPFATVSVTPVLNSIMSGSSGSYIAFVDTGWYDLEGVFLDPLWMLTTSPAVQAVQVTTSAPQVTDVDFGWAPVVDTSIVVPGLTIVAAPCGAQSLGWLSYHNMGTRVEQGTITLVLDPLFTFVGSTPPPATVVGNTVSWDFDSLGYFQSGLIAIDVLWPPASAVGQQWTNSATVVTLDDQGDTTGVFPLVQTHVLACSFDPNDKQVEPQGYGVHGALPVDIAWLTYTIRFQNTGTGTAYDVAILDELDEDLDIGTLQLVATSHAITSINIGADHEAVFRYDGIMLPDSGANEAGSHGFLTYRIRALAGSAHATPITNCASILFDLNPAVVTNTVLNTLVDCSLFTPVISASQPMLLQATAGDHYQWFLEGDSIVGAGDQQLLVTAPGNYSVAVTSIYGCTATSDPYEVVLPGFEEIERLHTLVMPNPAREDFTIVSTEAFDRVDVMDLEGRVVHSAQGKAGHQVIVNGSGLPVGMYMVLTFRGGARLGTVRVVID